MSVGTSKYSLPSGQALSVHVDVVDTNNKGFLLGA